MTAEFTHAVCVQFRDLDPRRHANHAAYVSYCEQAKAALFERVLGTSLADAPTVVRSLEVEFERSIELGDTVDVALAVGHLGRTSFSIEYDLAVDGERVATARTASIHLDGAGNPEPLPNEWHERLESYLGEA